MRRIALVFGVLFAAIGIVGLANPALLLKATKFTLASPGLYVVAAIRVVFGLVLMGAAATSRMPRTLRVLGAFIVLAGIVTPLFGVERTRAIVSWWSMQSTAFMRIWISFAVAFGLFIIYAVTPPR